jgi:hypothetical protein
MRAPPRHSSEERVPSGRRAPQPGFTPNRNTFFADPVEEWKLLVRSGLAKGVFADPARPLLTLRVTVGFVVLAALIGAPSGPAGSLATLVILASVLLVHELSRALVASAFGRSSNVVISASGGRTEVLGAPFRGVEAASFATIGSAANAVVAIAAIGITRIGTPHEAAGLLRALAFSHAVWAGAQLLPIIPFRAGIAIASGLSPSVRFAHAAASCVVLATAFVFVGGWMRAPLLLAVLALSAMASVNLVRDAYRESADADAHLGAIVLDAEARLSEGAPEKAAELAEEGLAVALSARERERLWKALAWAQIGRQDPFRAHGALLHLPAHAIDLHLLTAYLSCCNRVEEAAALLEEARSLGYRSPETTKLLADLLFRRGERQAVLALANSDEEPLSVDDRRAIQTALSGGG